MSAFPTRTQAVFVPPSPARGEAHWETENRMVWNELLHAAEEHELVYEITWISELGAWRRFLRSQRKLKT